MLTLAARICIKLQWYPANSLWDFMYTDKAKKKSSGDFFFCPSVVKHSWLATTGWRSWGLLHTLSLSFFLKQIETKGTICLNIWAVFKLCLPNLDEMSYFRQRLKWKPESTVKLIEGACCFPECFLCIPFSVLQRDKSGVTDRYNFPHTSAAARLWCDHAFASTVI